MEILLTISLVANYILCGVISVLWIVLVDAKAGKKGDPQKTGDFIGMLAFFIALWPIMSFVYLMDCLNEYMNG